MAEFDERETLKEKFQTVGLGDTSAAEHRRTQDLLGQQSGSVDGMILSSAAASQETQNTAQSHSKRRKRQEAEDALFMEMLRLGDLDTFVAETIFAGMDDQTIGETVALIETETGKSFDDYATDILGQDMPKQRLGETETEYHRRVLTLVGGAILNNDLSIKAGFEDDALARIIRADALYQEAHAIAQPGTSPMEQAATLDKAIDTSPAATADNTDAFASLAPSR